MAFWRTYYHLIWPTHHRAALLTDAIELRLYPYLVTRGFELNLHVYAVNGYLKHVHVALGIPPKHAVAHVVKHLKGSSSHYANHELEADGRFSWARGYGVLTFGERQLPIVTEYIHNQKQHHSQHTTNRWLEESSEDEIGPAEPRIQSGVNEDRTTYDAWDGLPF